MTLIKKKETLKITSVGKKVEKLELCSLLVGMEDDTAAVGEKKKTPLMVPQKAKHNVFIWLNISNSK